MHWLAVATIAGISKFCPKSMRRFQFEGLYPKWGKYYSIKVNVFVKKNVKSGIPIPVVVR